MYFFVHQSSKCGFCKSLSRFLRLNFLFVFKVKLNWGCENTGTNTNQLSIYKLLIFFTHTLYMYSLYTLLNTQKDSWYLCSLQENAFRDPLCPGYNGTKCNTGKDVAIISLTGSELESIRKSDRWKWTTTCEYALSLKLSMLLNVHMAWWLEFSRKNSFSTWNFGIICHLRPCIRLFGTTFRFRSWIT